MAIFKRTNNGNVYTILYQFCSEINGYLATVVIEKETHETTTGTTKIIKTTKIKASETVAATKVKDFRKRFKVISSDVL